MSKYNRLFHILLLVSVCYTGNVLAQEAVNSGNWSDSSTWDGGNTPQAGDKVTINDGIDVVLDTNTPELGGLTIEGKLSFSDALDLELTTEWILVFGELEIGTESQPHTSKATITLTDNVKYEQLMGMGDRGIMMSGGTLNLHGNITNAWTKLTETAEKGSNTIEVLNAEQWKAGDEIVLASTDFNPHQAETRYITAIDDNSITLDEPLEYMHFGNITYGVDERGEVGLLTRNIKVNASEDADESYFGGHIMAMVTSHMYVEGVELHRMGQHLELARYPIHWHLVGENGDGQYIRNAAIHDTFNRCVTVHGTDNLIVENNVTYNTVGHCFFLEDGIETGNQFLSNLGIQTKCHPTMECEPTNLFLPYQGTEGQQSPHVLIPSDNTVSTFWITNPDNTYRDNVAAGADQVGFWMAFSTHPTGAFEGSELSLNTWPQRMKLREFSGNTAHSNFDSLMLDRGPRADGTYGIAGGNLTSYADPADTSSEVVVAVFDDFTSYKNRNGAIWGRGEMHLYTNLKLADNAIGFTHAAGSPRPVTYTSRIEDSLFVGESDNIGNPVTPEEVAYGRSLPKPYDAPDFPIRGYEYYDYHHEVVNTTFVNYVPNELRDAGGLSYLLFTSFGMSTSNYVEGLKFDNAQPVSFPAINDRWSSDDGGNAAYLSAAFHDRDGSLSGIPNSYIVYDNGISADKETCTIQSSWNAAVCVGDMGRLSIGEGGGAPPRGGFPGFGDGGPAPDPVILSRNGREFEYPGQATIGSASEIKVDTARESLSLSIFEMDQGSWVIFELPGFTTAATGEQRNSLSALRNANNTSYYKDSDTLWVKLVVEDADREGIVVEPFANFTAQADIEVSK